MSLKIILTNHFEDPNNTEKLFTICCCCFNVYFRQIVGTRAESKKRIHMKWGGTDKDEWE